MKHWKPWTMLAVFGVQLALPAWTVIEREITVAAGETFRFRTTVVDPVDTFRGRYLRVGLAGSEVPVDEAWIPDPRRRAYASIVVDADGFARFSAVGPEPPPGGPYMNVRARWVGQGKVNIQAPVERFYLNEDLARDAERAYREHSGEEGDAYVTVAIRHGRPVLTGLLIEDEPIQDYVRRLNEVEPVR